jgi:hypothetical protein
MALTSPGVEVTITDQSQYLPAPTNSVPLVVLATAQNKADASGTGVAAATTAANANKLYQVTSQRDLVNLYGTPFFYTTANGSPIQGYELNEYGLLAAYSLLGVTNRCFVLRADIDLASLVGQTGRPTGLPANNTYWLDTTTSTWGIYEFNATTGDFALQTPIVITDANDLSGGVPLASIGNIGDYAVDATQITTAPTDINRTYWYKSSSNVWVILGGSDWRGDIPVVQGTNSNPTLVPSESFNINVSGAWSTTIVVPAASNNTVEGIASAINALNLLSISAEVRSGKLCLFTNQTSSAGTPNPYLTLSETSGTPLADIGITPGTYYQAAVSYGTSAQMPLWTASQSFPSPTGSVWIKVGAAGNGLNPKISRFNSATSTWQLKNTTLSTSDWTISSVLDSSGGQVIPAGSIYGQYLFDNTNRSAPVYFWERLATGPTIITGSATSPAFNSGPYYMNVYVSAPGSSTLSSAYNFTLADNTDATDFVTAWAATGIPYTTAAVNTDGAIVLTHTEGGEIVLDDTVNSSFASTGVSSGLITTAGFNIGSTTGVKYGSSITAFFSSAPQATTTGVGSGATFNIVSRFDIYALLGTANRGVTSGGSGYVIGDVIVIAGTSLGGTSPANDLEVQVTAVSSGAVTAVALTDTNSQPTPKYMTQLSNWVEFTYESNEGEPAIEPVDNTNWFWSVTNQVDIMVQKGNAWIGYRNTAYDSSGFPAASGSNTTDPNGPIISASAPTTQSDGTPLTYGDIWIDTTDLENYPVIYRWQLSSGVDQWVLINTTDQVSSTGVLFADARWATSGAVNVTDDPIPSIVSLLSSNYLDLDAPSPSLYPQGMMLFNTRRSGYNVKQFRTNYFNATSFPGASLPSETNAWVTVSGNQADGSPYMGRKAQRAMVVQALRSAIDTNTAIRDEDNFFNLMASPNYPEMQPNMVVLNADRGETAYIIGDTPMGLPDSATDIQAWANNDAGATSTGEDGLVTRNTYLGLFYPSGIANDLSGNEVAVPASHMMLRTFLRNDTIAYPWLAAAGTRRGTIDNALNIGYLDRTTGEFQTIKTRLGIRDVLYVNFINPLVFFSGVGLLNYGNKTSFNSSSALDRTNVARLIAYIRRQLTLAARPFVFEPNDSLTRQEIAGVVETLLVDLVAKRGIYDYLVVCDDSNNTPARIDRNELWIDVAVEPVKAAEFIYIPVRVLNTGELSGA